MANMANARGYAVSQLPERFKSRYDTEWKMVDGKRKFSVKGLQDSPLFTSLDEAHRYIATLETGTLADYIHRKYSHYGYSKSHSKTIVYNPEFNPHEDHNKRSTYQRFDRYRWVENVADGLRFVGAAGDIIRMDHTGWFTDNWQDETVHGEVYQMPARDGKPQYIPAVEDSCNKGCACLDFGSITDDKEEAARDADRMAERWAESEREYRAKDDAENRLSEIADEIRKEYTEFRRIAREIKANCDKLSGISVVRELVRKEWERTKKEIHKLRAERKRVEDHGIDYC